MGRPASHAEGGLANSVCNPQGRRGPDRERGKHGDDARFCTPFCASPASACVARLLRASRARHLCGGCAAATDRRGDRRRWRPCALALGASRAPLFRGADRNRRRGVRDLRDSTQRFARILAAAGAVGGRLSLRSAWGRHRGDHLPWRLDPGPHRRLSGTADHRGAEPHRDPVPVQPLACDWRRLAHGRARRRRDGARRSALSSAGRHRTRADALVHRRGDPDSDQPGQR